MNAREIIAKKQAGQELSAAQIEDFVMGYVKGSVPDYQMSALLMAIYFQGMSFRETADLVKIMTASGRQVNLEQVPKRKVDKHSTGGVGDKVSLVLAPIVAACGVPVPMISGRGLGHTGGTLDKLESIPGFTTSLTVEEFIQQVAEVGCALIGQTDEIVPADAKMYALRDVTATVGSIPLVAGSIMSKKIAEGINALLLDVKFGRGAIFPDIEKARQLAHHLVAIGAGVNLSVTALLTDMDQPLGRAVGNWIEVNECLKILRNQDDATDLQELCLTEAAIMLQLGEQTEDYRAARRLAEDALRSGRALDKFIEIARAQKADVRYLENPELYRKPAAKRMLEAEGSGFVSSLDALAIGEAVIGLGGGRKCKEDRIDYTAGIYLHKKCGDSVTKGETLATLYAASDDKIAAVLPLVCAAYQLSAAPPPPRPLIISQITSQGEIPWTS